MKTIIDRQAVAQQLGLTEASDTARLEQICLAVESLVTDWVPTDRLEKSTTKLGAEMLAARLWRRRQSTTGVETLGDLGSVYVARHDPDIAQLLCIGNFTPMSVM